MEIKASYEIDVDNLLEDLVELRKCSYPRGCQCTACEAIEVIEHLTCKRKPSKKPEHEEEVLVLVNGPKNKFFVSCVYYSDLDRFHSAVSDDIFDNSQLEGWWPIGHLREEKE